MKGFEFEPQTHYRFNCGYFLCDIKTFFEFYVTNSTFKGWKQKTRYKVGHLEDLKYNSNCTLQFFFIPVIHPPQWKSLF